MGDYSLMPIDKNNRPHGQWKVYWRLGIVMFKCNYIHGVCIGYHEKGYPDGEKSVMLYYIR